MDENGLTGLVDDGTELTNGLGGSKSDTLPRRSRKVNAELDLVNALLSIASQPADHQK